MNAGTIYVIGAGLAGLSAAVTLARKGARVCLIEGAGQAGGRCRSYFDPVLNHVIDNGNHLVLSGNHATQAYLQVIGASDRLAGPDSASFDFVDVSDGSRWTVAPNDGAIPWWVLEKTRRVPGTSLGDYVSLAKLLSPRRGSRIADTITCKGPLWDKLLRPLLLAALNTEPETASAELAAAVIRETLARGGRAYRPRIASPTLAAAFIDPALDYLNRNGATIQFGSRLREVVQGDARLDTLRMGDRDVLLDPADRVVLATPAWTTSELIPGIAAPDEFRAILNAHFSIAPPATASLMTGVIGGTAEWVFAFPDRVSVTVSGADAIIDRDRDTLAQALWRDVAVVHNLGADLPPWQIVKERRATFAATPEQAGKRAPARSRWTNLFLAGDWTDTGLPATIEGAIRSGVRAGELAIAGL